MKTTAHRRMVGLGVATGGALGVAFISLAGAPAAQAEPFFPAPPCIVTETGLCVPDTVWPIPAGGVGHLHPAPPIEPPGSPPIEPVAPVGNPPVPPPGHILPPPVIAPPEHHPVPPPEPINPCEPGGGGCVISCIVNEGCFTYGPGLPISRAPVDPAAPAGGAHDAAAAAPPVDAVGGDESAGHGSLLADLLGFFHI